MSEFNAALGLVQIKHIERAISQRKNVDGEYRRRLRDVTGIECLGEDSEIAGNYAYFPILINENFPISRDALFAKLSAQGIHAKRYFYPLISDFSVYKDFPSARRDNFPVAKKAADQILCLPIFPDLDLAVVNEICDLFAKQ